MYTPLQHTRPRLRQIQLKPPRWLQLLAVFVLVLGVFFRFVNLDRKVYWADETYTSLRISGYTATEVVKQVFNGNLVSSKEIQKYQRTSPERNFSDTVKGLALEEPQHPPLYFLMARFWVQWFGNSVAVTRSLSALLSLLVFPCLYWLCIELFESSATGWMAVALLAVSPFHMLYAQEARQYSLWTGTILLASAALLRAIKRKTKLSWGIYAVSLSLGLYSFLLTGLVAISHGIYVLFIESFRLTKTVIAYVLASLLGYIIFVPWLVIVIANSNAVGNKTNWINNSVSKVVLLKEWLRSIRILFLDFNLSFSSLSLPVRLLDIFIFGIVIYSIYFLLRKTPKPIWLFILSLIGVTWLALALPDLIVGGQRSTITRYLIPSFLGLQLAVAHLLATGITSANLLYRKIWQFLSVMLIVLGISSCIILSQAQTSWNKYQGSETAIEVAQTINQKRRPLVLSEAAGGYGEGEPDANVGDIFSLSYLLDSKVQMLLVVEPNVPQIPNGFSDVFLYNPSEKLRPAIEARNYKVKPALQASDEPILWKLEKR